MKTVTKIKFVLVFFLFVSFSLLFSNNTHTCLSPSSLRSPPPSWRRSWHQWHRIRIPSTQSQCTQQRCSLAWGWKEKRGFQKKKQSTMSDRPGHLLSHCVCLSPTFFLPFLFSLPVSFFYLLFLSLSLSPSSSPVSVSFLSPSPPLVPINSTKKDTKHCHHSNVGSHSTEEVSDSRQDGSKTKRNNRLQAQTKEGNVDLGKEKWEFVTTFHHFSFFSFLSSSREFLRRQHLDRWKLSRTKLVKSTQHSHKTASATESQRDEECCEVSCCLDGKKNER